MSSRQEFDRGGSRLRAHHRLHVCCFVAAVLGTVRRVDLVVEVRVGGREGHIFLDAAGPAFVACDSVHRVPKRASVKRGDGDFSWGFALSRSRFAGSSVLIPV